MQRWSSMDAWQNRETRCPRDQRNSFLSPIYYPISRIFSSLRFWFFVFPPDFVLFFLSLILYPYPSDFPFHLRRQLAAMAIISFFIWIVKYSIFFSLNFNLRSLLVAMVTRVTLLTHAMLPFLRIWSLHLINDSQIHSSSSYFSYSSFQRCHAFLFLHSQISLKLPQGNYRA